ncbi:hypothetical protein C1Y63_03175 [Corynebacterium sp. 13CS0277]|uniref:hypothetical protein n=1 Tax=Corynebacterium sp. 13CS0277 TaxID=2071994 RepID=UPI000D02CC55|nr:hypothetical protein [Corynebacterium sp. 13CS0277]PRQ12083.1 hypothetical protein C1Y63_03175 [Corynebacterium sp. 13CS0277]
MDATAAPPAPPAGGYAYDGARTPTNRAAGTALAAGIAAVLLCLGPAAVVFGIPLVWLLRQLVRAARAQAATYPPALARTGLITAARGCMVAVGVLTVAWLAGGVALGLGLHHRVDECLAAGEADTSAACIAHVLGLEEEPA